MTSVCRSYRGWSATATSCPVGRSSPCRSRTLPDSAARLSFLLLIPTTFGAVLWKGITDVLLADLPAGWQGPFVVGILAALASGLLAIVFLLGFVRRHTYAPFVVYRIVVAIVVLGLIASGVRDSAF